MNGKCPFTYCDISIFYVIFSLKLPAFSIPIRNMHPLSGLAIATCLSILLNDALVHAATNPSTITGAPVNLSTITGRGFTVSTATDAANGHQIGDEILGFNDPTALEWLQNQQTQTCSSSKRKRSVGYAVDFAKAGMDALSNQLQSILTMKSVNQLATDNDLTLYIQTVFDKGRANPRLAAVSMSFIDAPTDQPAGMSLA